MGLLAALCSAAPYEETSSSTAALPLPEKLVETSRSVQCHVQQVTIWDTEYQDQPFEECETVYQQLCEVESQRPCQETTREECRLVKDKVCSQEYKKVCVDEYKTVLEPYTETECVTSYKEDCEYHWEIVGTEKVWAPIKGSCKKNPYDECHDVQKTHSKQVAYPVCHDVPKEICHLKHKRVPVRISKTIPKKVCNTGYGDQAVQSSPVIPSASESPVTPTDVLIRNDETTF